MSVANGVLPRILAEYHDAKPAIELHLREGVHGAVLEDIRSGVADLGITDMDELPDTVETIPLGREVFRVVIPRNHRFAEHAEVCLQDLAQEPLISFPIDSRSRRTIDAVASRQGIALINAITVTQFPTMMSLVRTGLGVAIVPAGGVAGFSMKGLRTLPIVRPTPSRNLGVILLRERESTPAAKGLLALIRASWPRPGHWHNQDGGATD
jgi:DNA-binding transcriptional LysR family regulator